MSEPESKKARRLASFQVELVVADVAVVMESCLPCISPSSRSMSSGEGEDRSDDGSSSWLDESTIKGGGLFDVTGDISTGDSDSRSVFSCRGVSFTCSARTVSTDAADAFVAVLR